MRHDLVILAHILDLNLTRQKVLSKVEHKLNDTPLWIAFWLHATLCHLHGLNHVGNALWRVYLHTLKLLKKFLLALSITCPIVFTLFEQGAFLESLEQVKIRYGLFTLLILICRF